MVLERITPRTARPLEAREVPDPVPGQGELLLRVLACAVCRTDLHLVDGELDPPVPLPRIPGHQVVGTVVSTGPGCAGFAVGDCIGVAWLGATCGGCSFCCSSRENLCTRALFTGFTTDGGYAELMLARAGFVFALGAAAPADPAAVAPLLCAGMIGHRAYRKARPALIAGGGPLALYGFGAAARLLLAVARADGHAVYVHTRPGDLRKQEQARAAGTAFLARAAELSLTAAAERFPLEEANSALHAVRSGTLSGSAVLVPAA